MPSVPSLALEIYKATLDDQGTRNKEATNWHAVDRDRYLIRTFDTQPAANGISYLRRQSRKALMILMAIRYFETIGTPITAGRDFNSRDTSTSPRVAIISRFMAQKYFGATNPRPIRSDEPPALHGVDVVNWSSGAQS